MNAASETKPVRVRLMEDGMRLAAKVFENAAEEIVVSATIGVSSYPTDAAMYLARERRNSYQP